ncbi:MAG TPA: hypothetical protein VHM29_02380 [Acidimicrobiia bacterium]|jgi:hypothetical protein|nr:hypothetical protein [Acidimicrobiia bacterium]
MSDSANQHEERLLSLLRTGLGQSDPSPADVSEFAKAALSWRTIDADLAQLSYDSSEDSNSVSVRGVATSRRLAFESGELTIDLEHEPVSGHLLGQLEPAGRMTVELHVLDTVLVSESDELGRFSFDGIRSGPFALVIRLAGDEVVKTEWVIL